MKVEDVAVSRIFPSEDNCRKKFNSETLRQMAESIKENSLLNPITVMPSGDRFKIITGERRYRACKLLGLKTVPCVIRENASRKQMLVENFIENAHREDLDPWDKADGLEKLLKIITQSDEPMRILEDMEMASSLTDEQRRLKSEIRKLGISVNEAIEFIGVLELPKDVQKELRDTKFAYGRALTKLPPESRKDAWEYIKQKKLKVSGARKLVDDFNAGRISQNFYPKEYEKIQEFFMVKNMSESLVTNMDVITNDHLSAEHKEAIRSTLENLVKECQKGIKKLTPA